MKKLRKICSETFIDKQITYLNSTRIVKVWASKEAKLIICIAFFCSKFMVWLKFRVRLNGLLFVIHNKV